ncbi:MAG: hypothetical protein DME98_16785 [Verrucomicrobia bacterium]|nr:MAG: hypothetical protein DME98_16785 [Verrucomicrobiota bacterium]PYJ34365.1 MAG: hypothetical protein DME88_05585 [Verrucomicrobiota bacterium]
MYLICSPGCKQNSYDFFGRNHPPSRKATARQANGHELGAEEATTDYADDTDQESHRFSQIGSQNDGFLYR